MRTGPAHRVITGIALGALASAALVVTSGAGPGAAATEPVAVPIPLTSTPADGAADVHTEIPVTVKALAGEQLAAVTLAGPDGVAVTGTLDPSGASWTATGRLRTRTRYTITALGVASDGTEVSRESVFTTFAPGAGQSLKFQITDPVDGDTVGVGMPVMVQFTQAITDRAAVERNLSVISTPPQAGHWSWLSDARLDWRPEHYWQAGTKVRVSLALDGIPAGADRYGTSDTSFGFTVGRQQVSIVDLGRHDMTVYQDGSVLRSMPVTGGRPGLDTWGGTMAVIDKAVSVHMQSQSVGLGDAYDIPDVHYAVHLTYSGTYIHAAPWSVGSQGSANVSHGCVGMSMGNAGWFFANTLPGDIVQVTNSPRTVAAGNGFGDWQDSWPRWLAGSAVKAY